MSLLRAFSRKIFSQRNFPPTVGFRLRSQSAASKIEEESEKPIEYTKSPASKWQAKSSRMGTDSNRLWYEPHVVLLSIAVFMIYFCVLREENDVDEQFNRTIYSRIEGLEEMQLMTVLKYNLNQGLDTTAIEKRLEEIRQK